MHTKDPAAVVEVAVGGVALAGSTLAFLLGSSAIGAVALVLAGVAYGIAIARGLIARAS